MNRRFATYSGSRRQAHDTFGDILKVCASLILFAVVVAGQQRPAPDRADQSDQSIVVKWRADLRYLAEELPRRQSLFLLAVAYERAGKKDLAVKNYESALQLNPQNWEALDALRSLRAKAEGAANQRP